ncbi:MAG: 3-dehydroquinate synthase [Clostridia bacterium]|nr:3-dehydroquinate synthase [Clostridia bacterium]
MSDAKTLRVDLADRSYDITVGKGLLDLANKHMNLSRRVAIVTDSGVPKKYAEVIASLCDESKIITFPEGEESKNIGTYTYICEQLLTFGLQRKDAIVAVGGGVVGDMAGFAAATYMRGVDFYNVPTTLLSQVDSSIGGKTAIDFGGVKNILGAFYQPRAVLIDTDVLSTLDKRQISSGLAEVVKMSLTSDKELFEALESGLWKTDIADMIIRALKIKKAVVEADEREGGLRKILNFGHTFGHGIEALGGLYHGECVALGMIPMCAEELRPRVKNLLKSMGLPTEFSGDHDSAFSFMKHDKKGDGAKTDAVFVDAPGSYRLEKIELSKLCEYIKKMSEV